jgi:ferritin
MQIHYPKGDQTMLSKKILDAINEQINFELSSAYLYLSMAAHFDAEALPGFAHWMRAQYREETGHAMKFYGYIYDRGGAVTLKAIPQPQTKFKGPLEVFRQVLEHERKVTASINNIYALALKEDDFATQGFLQWFIKEQVEEEKNASDIIDMLKMTGESGPTLIMADRHLASRKAD